MSQYKGIYVVNRSVTTSTAITIIQIKAGANTPLELIRAAVTQSDITTNSQTGIRILRKTAAATVTSFTPLKITSGSPTADAAGGTSATGITATNEGTDGDVLIDDGFNALNGWLYLPTPEERITVPAGGFIALKFPVAPTSALWKAYMVFGEMQ